MVPLRPDKRGASRVMDAVRHYLKQIEAIPPLTREREHELFRRWRADRTSAEGRRAAAALTEANLRHVVAIARKHVRRGHTLLDLIQAGNLGLLAAMQRFDPARPGRFATYARPWIQRRVARAQRERAGAVEFTPELLEMLNGALRLQAQLRRKNGREPTAREIAEGLQAPLARVRKVLRLIRRAEAGDASSR
jgi:RNA polymerase primary sigma factor